MPVVPNFVERLAFLRLNRGPGPFLDLLSGGSLYAAAAAVELGIFEALAVGRTSPADLADTLEADEATLDSLLEFLAAGGYVEPRGHRYENTAMTRRWLTDREGTNMGPWLVGWTRVVLPFWTEQMETVLAEGEPTVDIYTWAAETGRADTLHAGFRAAARLGVEDALEVAGTTGPTRVLDLGGGHGLYSVALAEANPDLEAVVFDLPAAETSFDETVADADPSVAERITFRGGDYLGDDLGTGYDIVLLFNVVHAHDAETNRALVARAYDALAPGGRVVVMEEFTGTGPTPITRTAVRFVDFTYRVTLGAHTYPADEVTGWLEGVGFVGVHTSQKATGVGFAVGEKPT